MSAALRLRSSAFRREREKLWRELESLVDRAEKKGLRSLSAEELHRLPALYRASVSSLSVARAISLDRNMLDYLESLVTRAYFCIYGVKPRTGRVVRTFFSRILPRSVRRLGMGIVLALVLMGAGTLVGYTLYDPEAYHAMVPAQLAQDRTPTSTTAELRRVLYSDPGDHDDKDLGVFATFLFTHNAKVGLFSFALGFALGLPVILLLFYNGLVLGAMAGLYASRGLGLDFWAWVLPHGVTELLAVGLCGGAGMAVAMAILRPGTYGRLHALAQTGRLAAMVVLGAVGMFFIAGLIEGFFRQLVTHVPTRLTLAGASLLFWLVYFFASGRKGPGPQPPKGLEQ